ncbi:hypothetical protein HUT18_11825 [Streptomyces sp. NA04227]|uniref:hypothetical protein n=1 Tax=Streptomyces sp. NA04227 TaxID=2742136 RepID=UPI00159049EF|nr:hypothetical protein [Streptomyces sp. NA04227]QKW06987.1 hypothetical protein HUT18_11825 [Streptomyces sp. NA04227]
MGHSTDLIPADGHTSVQPEHTEKVALVLAEVAAHFTTTRPTALLEQDALLVSVGAEAYKVCGRRIGSDAAHVSRTALTVAPSHTGGITRGEYAIRLRGVLASLSTRAGAV